MLDITANDTTTKTAPFKINPNAGGHNGEVSMQWMRRSPDERYLSLNDLWNEKKAFWDGAFQIRSRSKDLELIAPELRVPADLHRLSVGAKILDGGDRQVVKEVAPTNWAFGQLAGLAKAPAAFLRELPSPIVCDTLNWRLQNAREVEEIKLYGGGESLYAATGPDYGRIPDYQVVEAVRQVAGSGRGEMRWKVPGVLDWRTHMYDPEAPVTKDSTTIYASDRDVFIFLVDDRNPIEIGKLADGSPDLVFRGFYIQNSEVGSRSLKIAVFYLRGVCMNRNLWGIEGFEDIKISHTRLAPDRWLQQAEPALKAYANGSSQKLIDGVTKAKEARIADDHDAAVAFLQARKFSAAKAKAVLEQGEKEEGRPVRTAWDFAQAITANARNIPNNDDRLAQEIEARKILDAVV